MRSYIRIFALLAAVGFLSMNAFAQDEQDVQAEKSKKDTAESSCYGKCEGALGKVVLGPTLTLLSLPRPFAAGLEAKYDNTWGGAFNYSFAPEITISSAKIKFHAWDVRAKWYPAKRSLFIGAAFGMQTLEGTKSATISSVPVNAAIKLETTFLSPHIGWNWTWNSGFFMGMDLGVQLALSTKTSLTTNVSTIAALTATAEYQKLEKDIKDAGEKVGKIPLPMITFLKFGYFF